jgi:hypothetical protein
MNPHENHTGVSLEKNFLSIIAAGTLVIRRGWLSTNAKTRLATAMVGLALGCLPVEAVGQVPVSVRANSPDLTFPANQLPPRLSVSLDAPTNIVLHCAPTPFSDFLLQRSSDLADWLDTGVRFRSDQTNVWWGPPGEPRLFFRLEEDETLTLSCLAVDASTIQLRWPPLPNARVYCVYRDGVKVGNTAARTGYFLDSRLEPNTTYGYYITALDPSGQVLRTSASARFSTGASSKIRTHYGVLVLAFYPDGPNPSELSHLRTYLRHRLDFIRQASVNAAVLEPFRGDVICIQAQPPKRFEGSFNIDYVRLTTTAYPELDGYSIVDLVERGDVDVVWVTASPEGCNFHENALVGNHDINPNATGEKWNPAPAQCSRSFFVNSYASDARSYDAYAHMVEGIMTTLCDGYPANWPRNQQFVVYTRNRVDFTTTSSANLHLFERFRLTDAWTGTGAYASPGNANCGSSHFPPNARRDTDQNYDGDYAYYDRKTWQRYVDCGADEWLRYPLLTDAKRKLNGYDFGAFNSYGPNDPTYATAFGASPELHPSFRTDTASYHLWWFFHLPHNPGVTNGKLNNWWPYLFDFNRFHGDFIGYSVADFRDVPTNFSALNGEFGTESSTPELWGYWASFSDFGPSGQVRVVVRSENPSLVRQGQYALKVAVDEESFHYNGRNDLVYPISRNARWNFTELRALTFAIKPAMNAQLLNRVNPVIRLCANGGNRLEFVPTKNGLYANFLLDDRFQAEDGWKVFRLPIEGNADWEINVFGFLDSHLQGTELLDAQQQLKRKVLSEINYLEISLASDGGRGDRLEYYVDDLKFLFDE